MSRDVVLRWKGQEYRIPENRAFEAGAELEEVVTLAELQSFGNRPKFFKIARAMGVLLRFAGAKVSDAEIKREIDASINRVVAQGDATEGEAKEIYAVTAISQLVEVLFDGAAAADGGEDASPGETTAS